MRERISQRENTSFQEYAPFDPRLDIKADVAMVYGLDQTLPQRVASWKHAGYIVHVMVGISWGHYQDYVRGAWDGQPHYDDAQAASGEFKLEHGVSQGDDIYYMVPTSSYVVYLIEQLRVVVDAGAAAIHLEEPEFWVRGAYSPSFKRAWLDYFGDVWQDPVTSPDARYRASHLQQALYTRAVAAVCRELKAYARSKGVDDFRCYVPTHSLLNYAHWRIVSPESQLIEIADCDGLIAQVWTGTARTRNVYQGLLKERTFDAAYCEYAAAAALVRGTDKHLWLLADPIEDDPNHSWEDYRRNWQSTVVASLLLPQVARYEVVPWPARVFKKTYPVTERLRDLPLREVVSDYAARLEGRGEHALAASTREAIDQFENFCAAQTGKPVETLGFAAAPVEGDLRFSNVLTYLFDFYHHLYAAHTPADAVRLRDAIAAFYENPTETREGIPAHYATELQIVFNALADMAWDDVKWETPNPGIGLCISDTLMYQRGEPAASDQHLSSVYGLALPLVKAGVPFEMVQLERIATTGYLDQQRILLLSYDGMKPASEAIHHRLVQWIRNGGVLIFFGTGDAYNRVRAWWNSGDDAAASPHEHLLRLLGAESGQTTRCGSGWMIAVRENPTALAYAADGAEIVRAAVRQACGLLKLEFQARSALTLRRGPYVVAAGVADPVDPSAAVLSGHYINLFDASLNILIDPVIAENTCWLLYDLAFEDGQTAWVVAASGRVAHERCQAGFITFELSGALGTMAAARVRLPRPPATLEMRSKTDLLPHTSVWDESSQTLYLSFAAQPQGACVEIRF
jgi:hypothetical protein